MIDATNPPSAGAPTPDETAADSALHSGSAGGPDDVWWRDAVVYQVYVRSFADSDGDGVGDLPGITARIDSIADLGVDAIWLTPFYVSPQRDGGYDVADYRNVDPLFGSLDDAEALIRRAHDVGLKVIIDIVPNHTSSDHRWFAEAQSAGPGAPEWERYHCVPGSGPGGAEPPNDWVSVFGGQAWSEVIDAAGQPTGYWYLHLFDASQPDLNWNHPDVAAEMASTLRFWFDRGVDGFRIDVAHGLVKAPDYPSLRSVGQDPIEGAVRLFDDVQPAPCWDQPEVHEIYRSWRSIADEYYPPRAFCGEVWVTTPQRQANYVRSDELHTVFNFDFLKVPWEASGIRGIVEHSLRANGLVGAPTTWVLSNHDVTRHASRFSGNRATALLRARAMTTFMLGLPGPAYIYQGEELGLPEVYDIPEEYRADPIFFRTGGAQAGRDGCRVPLPWTANDPSFGFGPSAESWLPQPPEWGEYAREIGAGEDPNTVAPQSTLALYRRLLAERKSNPALGIGQFDPVSGKLDWVDFDAGLPPGGMGPSGVIGFDRSGDPGVRVVLNAGRDDVHMPGAWQLLVASGGSHRPVTVTDDAVVVPPDCAAWFAPRLLHNA